MSAWTQAASGAAGPAAAGLESAHRAWDTAITAIDTARKEQATAPGLQEPAKKALATLDREWNGLAAHRQYSMISLDNNAAERAIRRPSSPARTPTAPTPMTPPGSPPASAG